MHVNDMFALIASTLSRSAMLPASSRSTFGSPVENFSVEYSEHGIQHSHVEALSHIHHGPLQRWAIEHNCRFLSYCSPIGQTGRPKEEFGVLIRGAGDLRFGTLPTRTIKL